MKTWLVVAVDKKTGRNYVFETFKATDHGMQAVKKNLSRHGMRVVKAASYQAA